MRPPVENLGEIRPIGLRRSTIRLPERHNVNRDRNMTQLIGELGEKLEELEEMGAFIAAAHLQAAIDSLRFHREIERTHSKPD